MNSIQKPFSPLVKNVSPQRALESKAASVRLSHIQSSYSYGKYSKQSENHSGFQETFVSRSQRISNKYERRASLVDKLEELGSYDAVSIAKKLKSCRCSVVSDGNAIEVQVRSCLHSLCDYCRDVKIKELRKKFEYILTNSSNIKGARFSFITLTQQNSGYSLKFLIKRIKSELSKFLNNRKVKNAFDGCFWRLETTVSPSKKYHVHLHLVVLHNQSSSWIKRNIVDKFWTIGFNKVQRLKVSKKSIMECVKYSLKNANLSIENLVRWAVEMKNKRTYSFSGIFRSFAQTYDKRVKEKKTDTGVPRPPDNFDEVSGEVFKLPQGIYSITDLVIGYLIERSKSYEYAIKLLLYRMDFGFQYERNRGD